MSTFRVNKNVNYTVMSNHHLQDKRLSLKAKGLLSYMLSLPDDWDYSLKGLTVGCRDGHGQCDAARFWNWKMAGMCAGSKVRDAQVAASSTTIIRSMNRLLRTILPFRQGSGPSNHALLPKVLKAA